MPDVAQDIVCNPCVPELKSGEERDPTLIAERPSALQLTCLDTEHDFSGREGSSDTLQLQSPRNEIRGV